MSTDHENTTLLNEEQQASRDDLENVKTQLQSNYNAHWYFFWHGTVKKEFVDPACQAFERGARALDDLSADKQQLQANNQQLQANNQQLQANNQQLQADKQQLQTGKQQLQADKQQLQDRVLALEKQVTATEQEKRKIRDQLTRVEGDLVQERNNSRALREDHKRTRSFAEGLVRKCQDKEDQISKLNDDLAQAKLREDQLQAKILQLERTIAEQHANTQQALAAEVQERRLLESRLNDKIARLTGRLDQIAVTATASQSPQRD